MSNPVSLDIVNYLGTQGVGTLGASAGSTWGIFMGHEPEVINPTITVYDTPGEAPNPKFRLDYPRFQVRVRSTVYLNSINKCQEVKDKLLGFPSGELGGTWYVGIYVVLDVSNLGADAKGREIAVCTFRVIREPNTGDHRIPL